jgi:hypothetical protein
MHRYGIPQILFSPYRGCNFVCDHCGLDAGPWQKDMLSVENSKFYIDQLSETDTGMLTFAGGEPTLHPKMHEIASYAGRMKEKSGNPKSIVILTNGSWAQTEKAAERELLQYKEDGVDIIAVSKDRYHEKFNRKQMPILEKFVGRKGIPKFYINPGESIGSYPLGRAKNLRPTLHHQTPKKCSLSTMALSDYMPSVNFRTVSIYPKGIFSCNWEKYKIGEIGERLIDVVKRAVSDPIIHNFGTYGVKRTLEGMRNAGILPKGISLEGAECTVCDRIERDEEALRNIRSSIRPDMKEFVPAIEI